MSQSKLSSFAEAWVNVGVGFVVNFFANLIILPAFGFQGLTLLTNLYLGFAYTGVSVARSYIIRRWFNSFKPRSRVYREFIIKDCKIEDGDYGKRSFRIGGKP